MATLEPVGRLKRRTRRRCPSDSSQCSQTEDSKPPPSREEAMEKYIKLAHSKRRGLKKRQRIPTDTKQLLQGQIMISIGRMVFNPKLQRGVQDRSFTPIKVAIHKECSHKQLLKKSISSVWSDATERGHYFLSDGSGHKITNDDFTVTTTSGESESVAWTLGNYLQASSIRYPSRARLYCVIVHNEENLSDNEASSSSEAVAADHQDVHAEHQFSHDHHPVDPSVKLDRSSHTAAADVISPSGALSKSFIEQSIEPPEGYFILSFLEKIPSRYASTFSFSSRSQDFIVSRRLSDTDRMHEAEELLIDHPHYRIFSENPLQHGFYLSTITKGLYQYDFIGMLNTDTGGVEYKKPKEGAAFATWSGCYASDRDKRAVLACPAINGFHPLVAYCWERDGLALQGEDTPILYCCTEGIYSCHIKGVNIDHTHKFCVSCVKDQMYACTLGIKAKVASEETKTSKIWSEYYSLVELEAIKDYLTVAEGIGELRVLEDVGQGAFGRVSKGVWRGSIVAAKEVPTAGNSRVLQNELNVYRSLNHPNLLCLLGTIHRPHSIVLIMNFVRGKSLHTIIFDGNDELTYQDKVSISRQICQGLVFMHSSTPPIAHLDLKPENILVEDHSLHVYLADFGLGKIMSTTRAFGTATMSSGTPGFQSPEQLKGEGLGISADVFAMGGVFTELFGGKSLWDNMTSHAIMFKVAVEGVMPNTEHLPVAIRDIVQCCLCPAATRESANTILLMLCNLADCQQNDHE